jgi:hypothetical protein
MHVDMIVPAKAEGQEQRRSDTTRPARAHNAHFGILMGLDASYPEIGFRSHRFGKQKPKDRMVCTCERAMNQPSCVSGGCERDETHRRCESLASADKRADYCSGRNKRNTQAHKGCYYRPHQRRRGYQPSCRVCLSCEFRASRGI